MRAAPKGLEIQRPIHCLTLWLSMIYASWIASIMRKSFKTGTPRTLHPAKLN